MLFSFLLICILNTSYSLADGDFVGLRTMPIGSNVSGKFIQYKPVGAKNKKKYPFGIRKIHTGDIVASDLDLAFYSKMGKSYTNDESLRLMDKINSKYFKKKKEVVRHGDNYNGELMGAEGALRVAQENDIIYIFNNKGLIDSGPYQDMVKKYIKGSKPGKNRKAKTKGKLYETKMHESAESLLNRIIGKLKKNKELNSKKIDKLLNITNKGITIDKFPTLDELWAISKKTNVEWAIYEINGIKFIRSGSYNKVNISYNENLTSFAHTHLKNPLPSLDDFYALKEIREVSKKINGLTIICNNKKKFYSIEDLLKMKSKGELKKAK